MAIFNGYVSLPEGIYRGFLKWGYPKLSSKSLLQINGKKHGKAMLWGTHILGHLQIFTFNGNWTPRVRITSDIAWMAWGWHGDLLLGISSHLYHWKWALFLHGFGPILVVVAKIFQSAIIHPIWNDDPDILGTGLKAQPVFQFWKWSSSHVISSVSFRPNSSNKANKKYVLELPSE